MYVTLLCIKYTLNTITGTFYYQPYALLQEHSTISN